MWKDAISPGQIGLFFSSTFPRQVHYSQLRQVPCGTCVVCPQLRAAFPQVGPLAFPIVWAQAFLIF